MLRCVAECLFCFGLVLSYDRGGGEGDGEGEEPLSLGLHYPAPQTRRDITTIGQHC